MDRRGDSASLVRWRFPAPCASGALRIGFVSPGQRAEGPLETFPHNCQGTVDAQVKFAAAEAVIGEKHGSCYPAMLALSQNTMDVDGNRV